MSEFKKSIFVNYTLNKSDSARIKKWAEEEFPKRDWLSVIVGSGIKASLSYSKRDHCYCCWLIPTAEGDVNAGLILSGRGGNVTNAVLEAAWKHIALFKGSWPRPTEDGESWTWDSEAK